ncbi:MAG: hypothetical protein IJ511_10570 [Bacteroides sp.]|nr:hypothetical protein [Bacteroides sp.]
MRSIIILMLLPLLSLQAAGKGGKTVYTDAAALTVVNRPQEGGPALQRTDTERYPALDGLLKEYMTYTTGLAVAFRTDSRNIHVRWTTAEKATSVNTTLIVQSGMDLYIRKDGRWTFAGVATPTWQENHEAPVVCNMEEGTKECLLYLPLFNRLEKLEIGVDEGADIAPLERPFKGKVTVIGSSITHGASASRPGLAYPAILERSLGMEFANLGACGLCRLDTVFADMAGDTDADALLIDAFSNPSPEQIRERLLPFVERIRKRQPDIPLIFLQTEVRETGNFDLKKRAYEERKRRAAEEGMESLLKAGYKGIHFINPGMPLGSDHEATTDGVHPTDVGFNRITEALLPQLRSILGRREEEGRAMRIRKRLLERDTATVIVASHRGDWRNFPENSLEAIDNAIGMGVDIVELDVQRTKDGVLILMHDETLDRTTTGKGKIAETEWEDIRKLKLRNGCAIRTVQRVPTLEQALMHAKGRIMLNLDKADRYFGEVYALMEKTGTTKQVIMKGSRTAEEVRKLYGEWLEDVIYMPIVNLDKEGAEAQIEHFCGTLEPVAFELLFRKDDNPLPEQVKGKLAGRALIWYNTLWDTMAGGHDDDLSLKDPEKGYGHLVRTLGARIIQTDRPQYLIAYLRQRGWHE